MTRKGRCECGHEWEDHIYDPSDNNRDCYSEKELKKGYFDGYHNLLNDICYCMNYEEDNSLASCVRDILNKDLKKDLKKEKKKKK